MTGTAIRRSPEWRGKLADQPDHDAAGRRDRAAEERDTARLARSVAASNRNIDSDKREQAAEWRDRLAEHRDLLAEERHDGMLGPRLERTQAQIDRHWSGGDRDHWASDRG